MAKTSRASILGWCALLAGCGASTASPASPRPEPGSLNPPAAANPTYAYYEVTGRTALEMWTSMRRQAPMEGFGRALWNVSWTMRWEPMPGLSRGCHIVAASVTLRTEVRLPHWDPPPETSPELIAQWQSFIDHLRMHENGHLEIAVQAQRQVESALRRAEAPSCTMMQGVGNETAERILTELRGRERAYDQRTHHGATQGAAWPPPGTTP
jgi:predicted secreted Zn-dependent protease